MTDHFTRVDAVLPAGGRVSGEFARAAGTEIKALIRFNESSILERTVRAVKALPCIGKTAVVGPAVTHAPAGAAGADAVLDELETGSANILLGIDWLVSQPNPAERILIVTTDMPFLTTEAIDSFLRMCPPDKDICVPLVERTAFEHAYPGIIRTDTRLADGWFRVGGVYLVNPTTLLRNRAHFDRYFAVRKNNIQMAKLIGLRTILGYVTHRLSSVAILRRAEEILGCTGAVIKDVSTELAFDIDLLEEYRYAVQRLSTDDAE